MRKIETKVTSPLEQVILGEIRATDGGISFARFMDLALYHPAFGYYSPQRPSPIGKAGDFVTSVSLGPLFGRILAQEILRVRAALGNPPDFCVVEYGSHRGELCRHILTTIPDLTYHAVDFDNQPPEQFTGCVVANEFLDALPVHRVHASGGRWLELFVEENPNGPHTFRERPGPLSTPRLSKALADLPVNLMEGYTTEVNLRALYWLSDIANRLTRGHIVLIDYGWERHEYFAPHRATGTLACYREHHRTSNPFAHVGEQDITTHVEYTSLMDHAKALGLHAESFEEQGRYLTRTGADIIREIVESNPGQFNPARATLNELTHPTLMGAAFKVLVLRKA